MLGDFKSELGAGWNDWYSSTIDLPNSTTLQYCLLPLCKAVIQFSSAVKNHRVQLFFSQWVMGPYNVVQQVKIPMAHGVIVMDMVIF